MIALANNPSSSQTYRAKRVLSIREALQLSRRAFNKIFAIPIGTLQHWENPEDICGLSEKGARTLSEALKTWHIRVNPEWLLHGIGTKPVLPAKFQQLPSLSIRSKDVSSTIEQEIALLHQLHIDVIDTHLDDDSMYPYLHSGDHVAGIKHYENDMALALDKDCIVLIDTQEIMVRHVCRSDIPGLYTLKSRNFNATSKPILYDVKLSYAAPIMWIRR